MNYLLRSDRWLVSLYARVRGWSPSGRLVSSLSLLLVLLVGCSGVDTTAQQLPTHLLDIYDQRTDSLLQEATQQIEKMTIEEQIGQLIIPIWEPRYDSASRERYLQLIDKIRPGGILFRKGDPYDQYRLTRLLQERSRIPLLITADAEWGLADHTLSTYEATS